MNHSTVVGRPHPRPAAAEIRLGLVLLLVGFACCFAWVKHSRSLGQQPRFYQENFGPAVMMACGYGFTAPPAGVSPPALQDFLLLRTQTFRCEDFSPSIVPEPVTWNGTWYYLYGTVALIWKVTGISWTALDGLAATFGALELLALYALFRLVSGRLVAAVAAILVLLAPFNLAELMMLRDFSKAPFVLGTVWLLAWLIMRPMRPAATMGAAAVAGVIVGIGYGFRSDLIVMVPFGVASLLLFLPGAWRTCWPRNLGAAAAMFLAFVVAGWPPLQGQRTGGCQFHYALLGLTSPMTDELNVVSPLYAFGDHFLDTFVDLKVGDYAHRIQASPPPILCSPDYDRASGELFFGMAATFPADLVVHAYGSVLTILRSGPELPSLEEWVGRIPWAFVVARPIDRGLRLIGSTAPIFSLAAVGVAWHAAPRLGMALTVFILFLLGYPAIEFEARHWFHLRFLSLWTMLLVWRSWVDGRDAWTLRGARRAMTPVAVTIALMGIALVGFRAYQSGRVAALIERYLATPTAAMSIGRGDPHAIEVNWSAENFAFAPASRASDFLIVTVSADGCGAAGPVDLTFRYDAPLRPHDMTSTVTVERVPSGPTRVFFPIFSQAHADVAYLRFRRIETADRPADCIADVHRATDRSLPLWLQMQVPPDWTARSYHQSLKTPRFLRFLE